MPWGQRQRGDLLWGKACSKNKSLKKPCWSVNVSLVSFVIFLWGKYGADMGSLKSWVFIQNLVKPYSFLFMWRLKVNCKTGFCCAGEARILVSLVNRKDSPPLCPERKVYGLSRWFWEENPAQHHFVRWLITPFSVGEQRSGCKGSALRSFMAFSLVYLERHNENQWLAA